MQALGGGGGRGAPNSSSSPQRQEQLTLEALPASTSRGRKEGCLAITALTWVRKSHTCSIHDKTEAPGGCPQAFPPGHQGGDGRTGLGEPEPTCPETVP